MLTKKFIIDFIGTNYYCEKLNREIHKQAPMLKDEIRNFVKMELIEMLDRHDIEINNLAVLEERVDEITAAISSR